LKKKLRNYAFLTYFLVKYIKKGEIFGEMYAKKGEIFRKKMVSMG
jgi:hypothetical protein